MNNSTVTLLLDQLRRESQKQKEDGDLKDGEYQEISELIGQIERAFTNGWVARKIILEVMMSWMLLSRLAGVINLPRVSWNYLADQRQA
jgi:hypothetical protein